MKCLLRVLFESEKPRAREAQRRRKAEFLELFLENYRHYSQARIYCPCCFTWLPPFLAGRQPVSAKRRLSLTRTAVLPRAASSSSGTSPKNARRGAGVGETSSIRHQTLGIGHRTSSSSATSNPLASGLFLCPCCEQKVREVGTWFAFWRVGQKNARL